jgi:hypothetical protein
MLSTHKPASKSQREPAIQELMNHEEKDRKASIRKEISV